MSTTADSDSDSEYIQIYEVDSEGNLVKDPCTGYKLTPEGREWDRKRYCEQVKNRGVPMAQLPPKFNCMLNPSRDVPTLHFGIPVAVETFMDYAKKHGMVDKAVKKYNIPPEDVCYGLVTLNIYKRLVQKTDCHVMLMPIFSLDYRLSVSLYTNYTMRRMQLVDEDEKEVLEILREELGTDAPAMWFWDLENVWHEDDVAKFPDIKART